MIILPINQILRRYKYEFFSVNSTTSTMDEAKFKINSVKNNFIILAEKQTTGRGRRGNKWISPPGNIYCSIALFVDVSNSDLLKYVMIVSVSVKISK